MDINYWKHVHKLKFINDFNSNNMPWEINKHDINLEWVLNYLNLKKGKVLELGCGTGNDANYLLNLGFEIDAIDINQHFINIAKQKNSKVNFICGDVYKDIPNKKYNLIYDRGFLHNVPYYDYSLIFKLLKSKLCNDGYLIILTGHPTPRGFNKMVPNPTPYYEVVLGFKDLFNIVLIKEIRFELNKDFGGGDGIIYILKH